MEDAYIIAEVGSNCLKYRTLEKNLALSKEQIVSAKACGADAVKFQFFKYEELYGLSAPKDYDRKFELPYEMIPKLKEYCDHYRIDFLCSAFSTSGFKKLDEYVGMHKIASPEAKCPGIVAAVQALGNPIIISNGCLTFEEQYELVGSDAWGADDVMLECVSSYPASAWDYDFSKIMEIARTFNITWGISDHTTGHLAAYTARKCGATYFEKHVDLAAISAPSTPDTCVSADRYIFEEYCGRIREIKASDYDKSKKAASKLYGRDKSWYRPLPKNEI